MSEESKTSAEGAVTVTKTVEVKTPSNKYEIFKNVYRTCLLITTLCIALAMNRVGAEIKDLRAETARIRVVAEKATIIAETTRQELLREIEEIQRDGIKLHFRLW